MKLNNNSIYEKSDIIPIRDQFSPEQIKRGTMHHTNKAFERYFQTELEDSRKIYKVTTGVKKIGKVYPLPVNKELII